MTKIKIFLLLMVILVNFSAKSSYALEYKPNELIIRTKTPITTQGFKTASVSGNAIILDHEKDPILGQFPLNKIQIYHLNQGKSFASQAITSKNTVYKLVFSEDVDIQRLVAEFKKSPLIHRVQPNFIYRPCLSPNDSFYDRQWYLPVIHMHEAWDITQGTANVVIAVVDTGIDYIHEDLLNNIWKNPGEIPNNGIDDDNNGYIDDVVGWDFVDVNTLLKASGEDYTQRDNAPMDFNGHGTMVSGIISAELNNLVGVAGIAPRCRLMCIRSGYQTYDGEGAFEVIDAAQSIRYAADNGAKIINLSWGTTDPTHSQDKDLEIKDAIEYAESKNCIVVVAASNDAVNMDEMSVIPASYPGVIAVSAIDKAKTLASYSNYGSRIDICAPGSDIISTAYISNETDIHAQYGGGDGTSFAAPIVSAVAGLIYSQRPTATSADIYEALTKSADDLGAAGKDIYYGYGLINAKAAIAYKDTFGPTILSDCQNQDYQSIQTPVIFRVYDSSAISANAFAVTITTSANLINLDTASPSLTWNNPNLTVNLSNLGVSTGFITIKVMASDIYDNTSQKTISLKLTNSSDTLLLTGPTLTSPILSYPNPFNPSTQSTSICYMISIDAAITIDIYSLNLDRVKRYTSQDSAGYHEVIWNGRDERGDMVPTGVYLLSVKAVANGKTVIKKSKIAILK